MIKEKIKKSFPLLTNALPKCIFARLKNTLVDILKFNSVEEKIITLRGIPMIIDRDVAEIYGVETKRLSEAVKNNPDKFPPEFIIDISEEENKSLRSKISTLKKLRRGEHTKYLSKAFTEQGLYMLATILKSPKATKDTLDIIQAFTKFRELSCTLANITQSKLHNNL
jgi:hypothetical protein